MPLWYIITASIAALGALTMIVTTVVGIFMVVLNHYEEEIMRWFLASLVGLAVLTTCALVIVFFGYVIA